MCGARRPCDGRDCSLRELGGRIEPHQISGEWTRRPAGVPRKRAWRAWLDPARQALFLGAPAGRHSSIRQISDAARSSHRVPQTAILAARVAAWRRTSTRSRRSAICSPRPGACPAWWIAASDLRDDLRIDRRHRLAPFGSPSPAMRQYRSRSGCPHACGIRSFQSRHVPVLPTVGGR